MDTQRIGTFALAEQRLNWLDARQRLLAGNVANADTPGFRARDAVPFRELLAQQVARPGVQVTHAAHISPPGADPRAMPARVLDRAPNGNAVSLDDQAIRIAETDQAHALAMNLYRKYVTMFRTALGRP